MADYRALYRKYRPGDFDDVAGQRQTTDILKYEVANNKISHAYLFCGSRGTGKTSSAKILAKAVNCLSPKNGNPCNECSACRSIDMGVATDVIEMDAASNNGVGNVRDMKEEIAFTPAELKYRVYIIDEVHMMSGSAFNALLKTLEEPPSYVVFILATTEFNKLPTTIVSRCQRFDFRRMTTEVIVERLMKIASIEGIDLTEDGAAALARAAEGGMRDAISLLELCAGSRKKVDSALVFETVGRGNRASIYSVVGAILKADYKKVYSAVADVCSLGQDLTVFWQELLDAYRDVMVVKNTGDASGYLDTTDTEMKTLRALAEGFTMGKLLYHTSVLEETLADLQRARESKRSVAEIALTKMCDSRLSSSSEALLLRIEELEKTVSRLKFGAVPSSASAPESPIQKSEDKEPEVALIKNTSIQKAVNPAPSSEAPVPYKKWGKVVAEMAIAKPSMQSPLAKAAVFQSRSGELTVKLDKFFVRRFTDSPENLTILKGIIAEIEGIAPEEVKMKVIPLEDGDKATLADEIETALAEE